jgi:hypothetical protein
LEKRFERGAFFLKPIRLYAASFFFKNAFLHPPQSASVGRVFGWAKNAFLSKAFRCHPG